MMDDLRIILIKENGNIVSIFCDEEITSKNNIEIDKDDDVNLVREFYKSNFEESKEIRKHMDRHLFYLHDYLKDNFVEEFKKMKIDPTKITDDMTLYCLLSELNNIIMINSDEHSNILIIPRNGVNKDQVQSMKKTEELFDKNIIWAACNDLHFVPVEHEGKTYHILEYGEEIDGKLSDMIDMLENDNKKVL